MKKLFKNILYICSILILGLIIGRNIWTTIDKFSGYKYPFFGLRETVIISQSMAFVNEENKDFLKDHNDRIQKYDIVCTNMDFTYETLDIYDVITFRNSEHGLICHRIIDKYISDDGKQMLVTRGDSNSSPDDAISYDLVAGRVYKVIPKIGEALLFIQSPYGMLGIFGSIASICAGILIVDGFASKKKKKFDTTAKVEEKPLKPSVYKRQEIEDIILKSKKVQNGGKYFIISRKNNKKDVE